MRLGELFFHFLLTPWVANSEKLFCFPLFTGSQSCNPDEVVQLVASSFFCLHLQSAVQSLLVAEKAGHAEEVSSKIENGENSNKKQINKIFGRNMSPKIEEYSFKNALSFPPGS